TSISKNLSGPRCSTGTWPRGTLTEPRRGAVHCRVRHGGRRRLAALDRHPTRGLGWAPLVSRRRARCTALRGESIGPRARPISYRHLRADRQHRRAASRCFLLGRLPEESHRSHRSLSRAAAVSAGMISRAGESGRVLRADLTRESRSLLAVAVHALLLGDR